MLNFHSGLGHLSFGFGVVKYPPCFETFGLFFNQSHEILVSVTCLLFTTKDLPDELKKQPRELKKIFENYI